MHFDILNRLGVFITSVTDRQTDRWTERLLAVAPSNVVRCALKKRKTKKVKQKKQKSQNKENHSCTVA